MRILLVVDGEQCICTCDAEMYADLYTDARVTATTIIGMCRMCMYVSLYLYPSIYLFPSLSLPLSWSSSGLRANLGAR